MPRFKNLLLFILLLLLLSVQAQAINYKMLDHQGKEYQLSDYKGKWVVLNYWAIWCPPCREEIPLLVDYNRDRKDVQVFGINYEPGINKNKLSEFVSNYFIDYPIIPITRDMFDKFGKAKGLPMTIFISPEGKIVKKYLGMLDQALLDEVIPK